jgi:enolase-phosphatase E1
MCDQSRAVVTTARTNILLNCFRMSRPSLYLLDVEGTLAPCSLIKEQLLPYARAHFESFLRQGINELELKGGNLESADLAADSLFHDLALLQAENHAESDPNAPRILPHRASTFQRADTDPSDAIPDIIGYINWLMDRDSNSIALKSLEGKICKAGFESGDLNGILFEDVPRAFAHWSPQAHIAIYSSGSTAAQRVLFSRSIFGDLTGFISGYFDTRVGPKIEAASYAAIATEMQLKPQQVCFLSDTVRELDAARLAGMGTRLVCRPGNIVAVAGGHVAIQSLDDLVQDAP